MVVGPAGFLIHLHAAAKREEDFKVGGRERMADIG
jgi:hypothetical protein